MKKLLVLVLSLALLLTLAACTPGFWRESTSAKPVIYLYPEEKQDETCDAKPVAYLYPQTETEITVRLDRLGPPGRHADGRRRPDLPVSVLGGRDRPGL